VNARYRADFEFVPWQARFADLLEHGQIDLAIHIIDDGLLSSHFRSEQLHRENWLYAVARDSRIRRSWSMKQ